MVCLGVFVLERFKNFSLKPPTIFLIGLGNAEVKHELRVQIYELPVRIHELRVQIHELRIRIHKLRVQIYELQD